MRKVLYIANKKNTEILFVFIYLE